MEKPTQSHQEGVGKLPPQVLESQILQYCGAKRSDVLIGPGIGEDAALIDWPRGKLLAISSDPIVGASQGAGRYLVHVNGNDIACKGGDPSHLVVTLIVPQSYGRGYASAVMAEIDQACREIGVAVVGGHTEITDRYENPVVMGTMLGTTDYNYQADSIRPGDRLIVTKHLGLEGMSILANDRPDLLRRALTDQEIAEVATWVDAISILPEARCIRDLARFIHDPTEGGFLGGLAEISRLGKLGLRLDREALPIHSYTRKAAQALGFDPLKLISSGVLLAVVPEASCATALSRLSEAGIAASAVGEVDPEGELTLSTDEELWRLLAL